MPRVPRPAIFLDRDGTIIEDRDYLAAPEGVELLPGAAEAISRFNRAGWPVIVVSNQSGIGRGLITPDGYEAVRTRLDQLLAAAGAHLTETYHCPHRPDEQPPCDCRKPLPGLFLRAAEEHGIDLGRSHYAGDRVRDIEVGIRRGGTGYLIAPGDVAPDQLPHGVVLIADLRDVANRVLGSTGGAGS